MKREIPARLVPLVREVQGNPRLQAGLALVVLLVLGWLFLVLGDLRKAEIDQLGEARQRYFEVRQLAGQDVWEARAAEAVALADALEAEVPPAASPGLAQATFQGWLSAVAGIRGNPLRVETQPPVRLEAPNADVVRIAAVVSGALDPRRAWEIVHRLEASTSLVTIPEIVVRSDGANQTFSLTVHAYYRVPVEAPREAP